MKALIIGAISQKGRHKGGVTSILNGLFESRDAFSNNGLEVFFQDTCLVKRKPNSIGKISLSNFRNYALLKKDISLKIRNNSFDCAFIHTSTGFALLKDLAIAKKLKKKKIKVIFHFHSADIQSILSLNKLLNKYIIAMLKKYADFLCVFSSQLKSSFVKLGLNSKKIEIIPNFYKENNHDNCISTNRQIKNVIFIGAIWHPKGIFDLFDVFEDKDINDAFHLSICGLPVTENDKKRLDDCLSGRQYINYYGFVESNDKNKLLSESDIFILPSYTEGFPVTILEAIAHGCFIISSKVGAVDEFFHDCGTMVKPGDKSAIKQALFDTLANSSFNKIREQNIAYSKQFTISSYIQKICLIAKKVCGECNE